MEHWVEEMEGWDDRPFSGGYAGLHDLAAADFSGAVSTGGTWLFMVSGRVVAVVEHRQTNTGTVVTDADVERFEGADGTAYAAPHPSVPLLVAMKTRDGETRGKYYTEKTPIDEVAATLEEGGFTGYVELSENVLSGDYYTLYQGGRATDLAFIGNARRLLTGDDAHERMADEVGIYEVVAVDLDVVDVPGAGSDAAGDAAGSATAGAAGAGAAGAAGDGSGAAGTEAAATTTPEETAGDEEAGHPVESPGEEPPVGESRDEDLPAGESAGENGTAAGRTGTERTEEEGTGDGGTDAAPAEGDGAERAGAAPSGDGSPATAPADDETASAATGGAGGGARAGDEAASVTERIAARTVPSVDPERTGTGEEGTAAAEPGEELVPHAEGNAGAGDGVEAATDEADEAATDEAAVEVLREEVRVTREELADTKRERDALAARVEELELRLDERDQGGSPAGGTGGPSLGAADAAAGTNLFVRYDSKGKLTLDDAHRGDGDADALRANLRLEHHTTFEDEGATVDGRPFRAWLEGTQRFRFVDWLVTRLPFEIRETGAVEGLGDLYDALPALDRVEFDGTVTVADDEGDREISFGVVGRDRMGDPLLVADLETTRDPVGESALAGLVTDASAIAGSHDTLAGAFYVTAAFYEPAALETAREATSGSLLSRDRRRSFVKRSRSRGYHLALVEARNASFHLSVPDL